MRQAIGIIGLSLPISLLLYSYFSGTKIRTSISAYYHTPMGDVLVGILCAIGVFLITYKGYAKKSNERISDKWVARLAGCSALGIALFPMRNIPEGPVTNCITPASGLTCHPSYFHFGSAAIFFVCLAIFCLFIFTKGDRTEENKIDWTKRNINFVTCGFVIIISIFALALMMDADFASKRNDSIYMFFWETVGIVAFATSWLTKGHTYRELKRFTREQLNRIRLPIS